MTHHAERAHRGIAAAAQATEALIAAVGGLTAADVRMPSLLPRWSRAHVISHLARNADGLVNLLNSARTGVERQMYASREDRDAAIDEGAGRGHLLLCEDLLAACQRFATTVATLPGGAWEAVLRDSRGGALPASEIPWLRMREVWVHLVDLDAGVGFDAVPADVHEQLLDDVVGLFTGRTDVPALTVDTTLADGRHRTWRLDGAGGEAPAVRGTPPELLAWLTGRGPTPLPPLPPMS